LTLRCRVRRWFDRGVLSPGTIARYWLPVIFWGLMMFGASTSAGSAQRTSRFLTPFLRWLFPEISHDALILAHVGVRKLSHLVEYAVLSALLLRAVRRSPWQPPKPWRWREAGWALACAIVVASGDEYFQTFWPGRSGTPWDVLVDVLGTSGGLALVWLIGRWRRRW
jgi:hypothetical protein